MKRHKHIKGGWSGLSARRRWPVFPALLLAGVIALAGCASNEDDVTVGYQVSGDSCDADITYSDANRSVVFDLLNDLTVAPWTTSFLVPGDEVTGFPVFLQGINQCGLATDTITVEITKDGVIFFQANDTGVGAIASTSGTL